ARSGSDDESVVALASEELVIAGTAVDHEFDLAALERRSINDVVAVATFDDERVLVGISAGDRHLSGQPLHDDRSAVARDLDVIVASRAVDSRGVRLMVADVASRYRRQVNSDLLHVGLGKVIDNDVVDTSFSLELDALDTVEVHSDVADVAEEQRPLAIGRDGDVLVGIGTDEIERVETRATFDNVAAVTRIPDEQVIAGAEVRHVVA